VLVSGLFLWVASRAVSGRRSYATITGKGGRAKRFELRAARWPLFGAAATILLGATVLPVILLFASSFAPSSSALFSDWTAHYWVGRSNPVIDGGTPGIVHNPDILRAVAVTLGLGLAVAACGMAVGLLAAYVTARHREG
jgi:iron(III) transport system permease protein